MDRAHETRPGRRRVALTVEGATEPTSVDETVRTPAMPWLAASILGGLLCAVAGWVVIIAPLVVAWLTTPGPAVSGALKLGTQLWLLVHGADATVGTLQITLVPLGLTALVLVMTSGIAGLAARQSLLTFEEDDLDVAARRRIVGRVTGAFAGSYAFAVGVASFLLSDPATTARALFGAVVIAGLGALFGSARTVCWRPWEVWPAWARPLPRAVLAAVLVLVVGACTALAAALYQGRGRITELTTALRPDTAGAVVLILVQLAYLPNLICWALSWIVGAGFTVGDGSVVSPTVTQVGLLPAVPVSGAIPPPTTAAYGNLWWLAIAVVAGVVAAWLGVRHERRARFDETALVGGLTGVLTALCVAALAGLSRGDLGTSRLAGLGPRPLEMVVMGTALLGLSGIAAGLIEGLVVWLRYRRPAAAADAEATQRLG